MGLWSEKEDERLIAAIQRWGTNWTKVAGEVGTRSADQCSSHWSHVLDPKINYCDWTEEEVRYSPPPPKHSRSPMWQQGRLTGVIRTRTSSMKF